MALITRVAIGTSGAREAERTEVLFVSCVLGERKPDGQEAVCVCMHPERRPSTLHRARPNHPLLDHTRTHSKSMPQAWRSLRGHAHAPHPEAEPRAWTALWNVAPHAVSRQPPTHPPSMGLRAFGHTNCVDEVPGTRPRTARCHLAKGHRHAAAAAAVAIARPRPQHGGQYIPPLRSHVCLRCWSTCGHWPIGLPERLTRVTTSFSR